MGLSAQWWNLKTEVCGLKQILKEILDHREGNYLADFFPMIQAWMLRTSVHMDATLDSTTVLSDSQASPYPGRT